MILILNALIALMGEAQTEIMEKKVGEKFRFQAQIIYKHVRLMTKSKRKKF